MRCPQGLLARFFAALGAFPIEQNQNVSLSHASAANGSQLSINCIGPIPSGLDNLVVSGMRCLNEIQCTIPLSCSMRLSQGAGSLSQSQWRSLANDSSFEGETIFIWNLSPKISQRGLNDPEQCEGSPEDSTDSTTQVRETSLERKPSTLSLHGPFSRELDMKSPVRQSHGLLSYLLSVLSRHAWIREESDITWRDESHRKALEGDPAHFGKRSSQDPRALGKARTKSHPRCDETICFEHDLEKRCGPVGKFSLETVTDEICKMCYPRRNRILIKVFCEKQKERELQAFYGVCMVFAAASVTAGLLYLLCKLPRHHKQRSWFFSSKKRDDVPDSYTGSAKFLPGLGPLNTDRSKLTPELFTSRAGMALREFGDATDKAKSSIRTFPTLQRKLNRLSVFTRLSRRRIQDVFDLESLKPTKKEMQENAHSVERVPVLPRAPNASVRRHLSDFNSDSTRKELHRNTMQCANDWSASTGVP